VSEERAPYGDLPPLTKEEREGIARIQGNELGWASVPVPFLARISVSFARDDALLDALTKREPWYYHCCDGSYGCVYCDGNDKAADDAVAHTPDCPWRRAKDRGR